MNLLFSSSAVITATAITGAMMTVAVIGACQTTARRTVAGFASVAKPAIIQDDLVDNLSCEQLTLENVLNSTTPEKIQKRFERIGPLSSNFDVPGMYGHCWAITKAQRKALLLLRLDTLALPATSRQAAETELAELAVKRTQFLNLVRGSVPDLSCWGNSLRATIDTCSDSSMYEEKNSAHVVTVRSERELHDLVKLSQTALPISMASIPPPFTDGTAWLERNREWFPGLWQRHESRRAAAESVMRYTKQMEADLHAKRTGIQFRENSGRISREQSRDELQAAVRESAEGLEAFRLKSAPSDRFITEVPDRTVSSGEATRSLKDDLIKAQTSAFLQPSNLRFLGAGRARSKSENIETKTNLVKQLAAGRLPMLNLRFSRTRQHIVLVQRFIDQYDGSIEFKVYDSNERSKSDRKASERDDPPSAPYLESLVYRDGQFRYLKFDEIEKTGDSPIGVFIVDDLEMNEIQQAVYDHYRLQCAKISKN